MTDQSEHTADPGLLPYVRIARADLVARLGIDDSMIITLSASVKIWPDGALGCPRPGMRYVQRPIDGSLIELAVGAVTYRYHSGGSRPPFLCEPDPASSQHRRR